MRNRACVWTGGIRQLPDVGSQPVGDHVEFSRCSALFDVRGWAQTAEVRILPQGNHFDPNGEADRRSRHDPSMCATWCTPCPAPVRTATDVRAGSSL